LLKGKLDVVIQCSNKIWDIHPLIPIIEAAGGIVSTWNNDNAIKAGNIICSANRNHSQSVNKNIKTSLLKINFLCLILLPY
jgi:fructose-1,6-bisphosphatase/inositol monophosphatase family enzyme